MNKHFTHSVGRRLGLGFASLAALSIVLVVQGLVEYRVAANKLHEIVDVNNPKSALASQLLDQINTLAIQARSIMLLTEVKEIDAEVKLMAVAEDRYLKTEQALSDSLAAGAGTEQELRLSAQIFEARKKTLPLFRQVAEHGKNGQNIEGTSVLVQQVRPAEMVWRQRVADLIVTEQRLNAAAVDEAHAEQRRAMLGAAALGSVALVLGGLLAWRITRSVTQPIRQAIEISERIACGDLTSTLKIESKDEFGRLLESIASMQQRLRELVTRIQQSVDSINVASAEVAQGNTDLSERTEHAASNLEQTSNSLEELVGAVRQTVDSAYTADQLASSASAVAERGGQVVGQVVSTMSEINTSANKISDITGVIDGIAFQTNILALNAAVEAARAGEQGRGFAVVAGEVRQLAQRSAEAAKAIKALIATSVDKVDIGSRLVQEAGETMNEIVASVQRVSDFIGKIKTAASHQSASIDQVNTAVTQIDSMTQQNAALVEESAAAAESLREQANHLSGVVSAFRVDEVQPVA